MAKATNNKVVALRRDATAEAISRHDRLLDEAARELNAKGISLTSLSDIAKRLDLSRAALYYYVEDREDLVFQCYRRSCEIMARHLGEAIRIGRDAAEVIRLFTERMLDPDGPEMAARAEMAYLRATQQETVQGLYDAVAARLAGVLESGARSGIMRSVDYTVCAHTIISMLTWSPVSRSWSSAVAPLERQDIIAALNELILNGYAFDKKRSSNYRLFDLTPLETKVHAAFDREAIGQAKRETLLATASRLFNSKGVDTTSLEEIAAQVGATKRALYHHLGDKHALVAACYVRAYRIFCHIMDGMKNYDGLRVDAIGSALHAVAVAYMRPDLAPLSPLVGYEALNAKTKKAMHARAAELAGGYRAAFHQGVAEKSVRALDLEAVLLLLPGIYGWLVRGDTAQDDRQRQQVASEIVALLSSGVLATKKR